MPFFSQRFLQQKANVEAPKEQLLTFFIYRRGLKNTFHCQKKNGTCRFMQQMNIVVSKSQYLCKTRTGML